MTAYFVAMHPYMFRFGQPAEIVGVRFAARRACFHLRWPDGVEDDAPIENRDWCGACGLGVAYDIVDMPKPEPAIAGSARAPSRARWSAQRCLGWWRSG